VLHLNTAERNLHHILNSELTCFLPSSEMHLRFHFLCSNLSCHLSVNINSTAAILMPKQHSDAQQHSDVEATFRRLRNIPTSKQHSDVEATFRRPSNIPTSKQHSDVQATFRCQSEILIPKRHSDVQATF
jgi:hypothetical protein